MFKTLHYFAYHLVYSTIFIPLYIYVSHTDDVVRILRIIALVFPMLSSISAIKCATSPCEKVFARYYFYILYSFYISTYVVMACYYIMYNTIDPVFHLDLYLLWTTVPSFWYLFKLLTEEYEQETIPLIQNTTIQYTQYV